jgi:hypothetical protein
VQFNTIAEKFQSLVIAVSLVDQRAVTIAVAQTESQAVCQCGGFIGGYELQVGRHQVISARGPLTE